MEREFDLGRSLAAVLAGAPLGGALTSLALVLFAIFTEPGPQAVMIWPMAFLLVALVATVLFAIGIAVVATPGWFVLRKAGFSGWVSHSLFAAVMTGGAIWLFTGASLSLPVQGFVLMMSAIGGVVGGVMWRIAYRD